MKKFYKILSITTILSMILGLAILFPGISKTMANEGVQWGSWTDVKTGSEMFWGNLGDWKWEGNEYVAYHQDGTTDEGNFISWTDFGTGLGEELTNYKVTFKTRRPPDGQGTPGFSLAAEDIGQHVFGQAPYQAIAKGFGLPIWYFGDWMGRPGGNTVSWIDIGNPAEGEELVFDIKVTAEKFVLTINGYTVEDMDNPPNGARGYFGLGGQHIEQSPSTGVVFYDIKYALPFVATPTPEATPTPVPAATPTSAPGVTPTNAPTAPVGEMPSDNIPDKEITVIEVNKEQSVEITSKSEYPYPGFWEENKQIWINLQSGKSDNFPDLVAPHPNNDPVVEGGAGLSIDNDQQFYYFDESNSPGNVPPTLGTVSGGNGQPGKFTIKNGPEGSYTKIMSALSPSGADAWPSAGKAFEFSYFTLEVKLDGENIALNNPYAVIIKWALGQSDETDISQSSSYSQTKSVSQSPDEDSEYESKPETSDSGQDDESSNAIFIVIIAIVIIGGLAAGFFIAKKKGIIDGESNDSQSD